MFIRVYYLLPHRPHSETSEGFGTKLMLQTLCTSSLYFFFFPFVFLPAVLLQGFCHCTSARPRTPIYRAFKRTNSYLQIYLVKP